MRKIRQWAAQPLIGFGLSFLFILWGAYQGYIASASSFRAMDWSGPVDWAGVGLLLLLGFWAVARLTMLPLLSRWSSRVRLLLLSASLVVLVVGLLLDMSFGRELYMPLLEERQEVALTEGFQNYRLLRTGERILLATPEQVQWEGSLQQGLRAGDIQVDLLPITEAPMLVIKSGIGHQCLLIAMVLLILWMAFCLPALWRLKRY